MQKHIFRKFLKKKLLVPKNILQKKEPRLFEAIFPVRKFFFNFRDSGINRFEKKEYPSAISHLERAVKMYPKPIGRFHLILGQMYFENGDIEKARGHAQKAVNINPNHEAPLDLLKKITN